MLSVYKQLKPPKFGNCRAPPVPPETEEMHISFQDYLNAYAKKKMGYKTHKSRHIEEIKEKIKGLVKTVEWQSSDIIYLDELMNPTDLDQLIYSNCGFLCKKMLQRNVVSSCEKCSNAFRSVKDNSIFHISLLIQLRDKGKLIYRDLDFFRLIKSIDQLYSKYASSGKNETYAKVVEDIHNKKIELFFPCDKHKEDILTKLIYYYVLVGMYFFRRDERKNKVSETKHLKKTAKLVK